MHQSASRRNVLVLANAVELGVGAALRTLGNDSSKTIDGVKQTRQMLTDAIVARINTHLSVAMGGK